jgi:hypothetical protein
VRRDAVSRLCAGEPEELLRSSDQLVARELYARVACVARGDHLSVADHLVLEAQRGLACAYELGAERQLVVEEGGSAVADESLHDDEAVALLLQRFVGEAGGAQPLDATDLEVGEVVGVVDVPLRVGLGIADPESGLVDYY